MLHILVILLTDLLTGYWEVNYEKYEKEIEETVEKSF